MEKNINLNYQNMDYSDELQKKTKSKKYMNYDIISKENVTANKLIIYIHGGGLIKGDKSSGSYLAKIALEESVVVCLFNYPLTEEQVSENLVGLQIKCIDAGINKLLRTIQYQIDNITIIGHSAGAYLAALYVLKNTIYSEELNLVLYDCAAYNLKEKFARGTKKARERLTTIFRNVDREDVLRLYSPYHIASLESKNPNARWHFVSGKGEATKYAAKTFSKVLKTKNIYAKLYETNIEHDELERFIDVEYLGKKLISSILANDKSI